MSALWSLWVLNLVFVINFVCCHCQTPLDAFINAPDPYYSYQYTNIHVKGSNSGGAYDAYLINMTSQMWLNSSFVNNPIWWHYLWIIVPDPLNDVIYKDYATIIISSAANGNTTDFPKSDQWTQLGSFVATMTKTIVGIICSVPNKPLLFWNDPKHIERDEAQIMAFAEHEFGELYKSNINDNYRYEWIVEFAMTKAVIKGMESMDAIHSFIYKNSNDHTFNINITRFGVCGGSKRGLTTWLTAAADNRIKLLIPIVMDMPNENAVMHHQYRSYNGWSYAFSSYYAENITREMDSNWMYDFFNASDPLMFFDRYSDRYKLIIDGINDEWMMPDDSYYWYDQLLNVSITNNNLFYQMIPNCDHGGAHYPNLTAPTVATFVQIYLSNLNEKLPQIRWKIENETGDISVHCYGDTAMIQSSSVWFGRSCSNVRRDFRLYNLDNPCKCGVQQSNGKCMNTQSVFSNKTLNPLSNMTKTEAIWMVSSPNGIPNDYWNGFELAITIKVFDNIFNDDINDIYNHSGFRTKFGELILTTQASIVPQRFPFPDCNGAGCYGVLV